MKKYLILTASLVFLNISMIGSNANPTEENVRTFHTVDVKTQHDTLRLEQILNHFKASLDNKDLFFKKLISTSDTLGVKPEWLLKVICKESRANPKAINPHSKATGLIQWLPSTARDLGTSINDIYHMSIEEQFDLSIKYFRRQNVLHKVSSYEDLYLAVFYPKAVGMNDDYIIGHMGSSVVKQNYPISKNGIITVGDFKRYAKVGI